MERTIEDRHPISWMSGEVLRKLSGRFSVLSYHRTLSKIVLELS